MVTSDYHQPPIVAISYHYLPEQFPVVTIRYALVLGLFTQPFVWIVVIDPCHTPMTPYVNVNVLVPTKGR